MYDQPSKTFLKKLQSPNYFPIHRFLLLYLFLKDRDIERWVRKLEGA